MESTNYAIEQRGVANNVNQHTIRESEDDLGTYLLSAAHNAYNKIQGLFCCSVIVPPDKSLEFQSHLVNTGSVIPAMNSTVKMKIEDIGKLLEGAPTVLYTAEVITQEVRNGDNAIGRSLCFNSPDGINYVEVIYNQYLNEFLKGTPHRTPIPPEAFQELYVLADYYCLIDTMRKDPYYHQFIQKCETKTTSDEHYIYWGTDTIMQCKLDISMLRQRSNILHNCTQYYVVVSGQMDENQALMLNVLTDKDTAFKVPQLNMIMEISGFPTQTNTNSNYLITSIIDILDQINIEKVPKMTRINSLPMHQKLTSAGTHCFVEGVSTSAEYGLEAALATCDDEEGVICCPIVFPCGLGIGAGIGGYKGATHGFNTGLLYGQTFYSETVELHDHSRVNVRFPFSQEGDTEIQIS